MDDQEDDNGPLIPCFSELLSEDTAELDASQPVEPTFTNNDKNKKPFQTAKCTGPTLTVDDKPQTCDVVDIIGNLEDLCCNDLPTVSFDPGSKPSSFWNKPKVVTSSKNVNISGATGFSVTPVQRERHPDSYFKDVKERTHKDFLINAMHESWNTPRTMLQKLDDACLEDATYASSGPSIQMSLISLDSNLQTVLPKGKEDTGSAQKEIVLPDNFKELIDRAACCQYNYSNCNDSDCMKGQKLINHMMTCLRAAEIHLEKESMQMIKHWLDHSYDCPQTNCRIPWCLFFQECDENNVDDPIVVLNLLYCVGTLCFTNIQCSNQELYKFSNKIAEDNDLIEGKSWWTICRRGRFGNSVLASENLLPNSASWIIRKIPFNSETDDIAVLKLCSNDATNNIVNHNWALQQGSFLCICMDYESGGNLTKWLDYLCCGLSDETTKLYFVQMIDAVSFLHASQIYYFQWISKNIVINNDGFRVKLTNFIPKIHHKPPWDDEAVLDLLMGLPPEVIPPEIFSEEPPVETSDVWGLGHILHEMITGYNIHCEHRHMSDEELRNIIKENGIPQFSCNIETWANILKQCWKVDPKQRPSFSKLKQLL